MSRRKMTAKQAQYFAPKRSRARTRVKTVVRRVYVRSKRTGRRAGRWVLNNPSKISYLLGAVAGAMPLIQAAQSGGTGLIQTAQSQINAIVQNPIGYTVGLLSQPDVTGPLAMSIGIPIAKRMVGGIPAPFNQVINVVHRAASGYAKTHILSKIFVGA